MENIKNYLNTIIANSANIKTTELKKEIFNDFLSSGILPFNNDASAPFVTKGNLVDILEKRVHEGELGKVAVQRVQRLQNAYSQVKKQDSKLSFSLGATFENVGSVSRTFNLFVEALQGIGEMSRNYTFTAPTKNPLLSKELKSYEGLIATNVVRFEDMFQDVYGRRNPNQDAVAAVATILTLRAIAQNGEEDAIDNLAEQLYPYLLKAINNAGGKYVGDEELYKIAEGFAIKRIAEINKGLKRHVIAVDLKSLRKDERIFQEVNKYNNDFTEYNINFYNQGSNPALGYVGNNGKIQLCDIEGIDYDLFEELNTRMIPSAIDTDEEVFTAMLTNLLVVENSNKYNEEQKRQLSMAFALPLVQAMNKIGDQKSNELMKGAIEKLAKIHQEEKSKYAFSVFKEFKFNGEVLNIKPREQEKSSTKTAPKKQITDEKVREKLIDKFKRLNQNYYNEVKNGKRKKIVDKGLKCAQLKAISGLLELERKNMTKNPENFIEIEKDSKELDSLIMKEFAQVYLIEKTKEVVSSQDKASEKINDIRKQIGKFHTERVKKSKALNSENKIQEEKVKE